MTWWMWTLAPVIYVVIGLFVTRHEYVADVKQEGRADDTGYYVFTALVWPTYLVIRLGVVPLIDLIKLFFDAPLRKHRAEEDERKQAITFWTQEWDKAEPGSPECDVAWQALESMGMVPDAETQFRKRRRLEGNAANAHALKRVQAHHYTLADNVDWQPGGITHRDENMDLSKMPSHE